jgi:hypothetical protein
LLQRIENCDLPAPKKAATSGRSHSSLPVFNTLYHFLLLAIKVGLKLFLPGKKVFALLNNYLSFKASCEDVWKYPGGKRTTLRTTNLITALFLV